MRVLLRRCLREHGNLSHACGCLSLRATVLWASLFQIVVGALFVILAVAPGWRLVDFVDLSFELRESLTAWPLPGRAGAHVVKISEPGATAGFPPRGNPHHKQQQQQQSDFLATTATTELAAAWRANNDDLYNDDDDDVERNYQSNSTLESPDIPPVVSSDFRQQDLEDSNALVRHSAVFRRRRTASSAVPLQADRNNGDAGDDDDDDSGCGKVVPTVVASAPSNGEAPRFFHIRLPHLLHLSAENKRLHEEMQKVALRFERYARVTFALYGGQSSMRGILGGLAAMLADARVSWHLWLWTAAGGLTDTLLCVMLPVALWMQGAVLSVKAWALLWLPCLCTPISVWWQSQLVFSLFRVQSVGGKGNEYMDAQQLQVFLTDKILHSQ